MQTYIVAGLVILSAGYAGWLFLRRTGLLGEASGCGCACSGGCGSSVRAAKTSVQADAGSGSSGAKRGAEILQTPTAEGASSCSGCCGSGACGRSRLPDAGLQGELGK